MVCCYWALWLAFQATFGGGAVIGLGLLLLPVCTAACTKQSRWPAWRLGVAVHGRGGGTSTEGSCTCAQQAASGDPAQQGLHNLQLGNCHLCRCWRCTSCMRMWKKCASHTDVTHLCRFFPGVWGIGVYAVLGFWVALCGRRVQCRIGFAVFATSCCALRLRVPCACLYKQHPTCICLTTSCGMLKLCAYKLCECDQQLWL
jgi:hypothetical protein